MTQQSRDDDVLDSAPAEPFWAATEAADDEPATAPAPLPPDDPVTQRAEVPTGPHPPQARNDARGPAAKDGPVRPPPTAAAFTEERMLRPADEAPEGGWRRVVYKLTGGAMNPGPSAAEQHRRELIGRVKTPVTDCRKIAVISRKGGVGKTTTTLMLGHTFASYRGDRVVALDGNPDAGSLGYRVRRETTATVTDLLDAGSVERYADIRGFTSQAGSRLEIVAADDDPHISTAIGESEYDQAIKLLEHHYNLILLDTGTGILDSATRGILSAAEQLVVVMAPSLDGARAASLTLDWLDQHGYGRLVGGAVAVLNQVRPRGLVELQRVEEHFSDRCRAVRRIPWDATLDAGAETQLTSLKAPTKEAYLELAAAVADGFISR